MDMYSVFVIIASIMPAIHRNLYSNSFSFQNYPALFNQLTKKAQEGLESNPKDFKGLNKLNRSYQLAECNFDHSYPQAIKVLNGEVFQNRPQSLDRLTPLAQSYEQKIEEVSTAIALKKEPNAVQPLLKELIKAHNKFQETFNAEQAAHSEPSPIQNKPVYPSFCYESLPSLLPQLTREAEYGLNLDPKDFKGLNRLNKFFRLPECLFEYFYRQAIRILDGETFQDLPGALGRLVPLAERYQQKLEEAETAIAQKEEGDVLKPILEELITAHRAFRETFTIECEAACPYEPFTIRSRYPKTLELYHRAFLNELFSISPELYDKWKEDAENFSGEMLPIIHRLAILWLLDNSNALVPDADGLLFDAVSIASLRRDYQALSDKDALRKALREECEPTAEVRDLFRRISAICSLQDPLMNGVARIIYGEIAKCFSLLDQMEVDEYPRDFHQQHRIVLLAVLKQPDCENLPCDLSGGEIEPLVRAFYKKYQELSEDDRAHFERLFLKGKTDSDNIPVYHLLNDWQKVIFHWGKRMQFLLYRLPQIVYHRSRNSF